MNKQRFFRHSFLVVLVTGFVVTACVKDLDRQPFYDLTSASVYNTPANYKNVLAKCYAGLSVSGQQGPAGAADISGIDEGFSSYLRQYWQFQELTTDEAVIGWNDSGLPDLHNMTWTSTNAFVTAMYNRIYYQISLCNEFIRESTDAKLASRNIAGTDLTDIKTFRAEVRFLRALSYYHALDLYGNVPFVTETDEVGAFQPKQIQPTDLFAYVESELKATEPDLVDARKNEYGRADKAAAWTLLTKLYLNAQVYTGQAKNTEAITYASKVIGAGYILNSQYNTLFLADNNTSPEIIFPITFDGTRTKNWGGMTYLVHAQIGGKMNVVNFGVSSAWAGLRTTKNLVAQFTDPSGKTDQRALFFTDGQSLEINDITAFTDGYAIAKYKNVTANGVKGSDPTGDFPDTDYPLFRLADVYLMYAEAVLRGGTGGDQVAALGYVNALRRRAYGNATGNVATINLDFILTERARELYWESQRRTDLIRFDKFTGGTYLWPYKGGVKEGRAVPDYLRLLPIPSSDIVANPGLKQNSGY